MFTKDQRLYLRGCKPEFFGDERTEPRRIKHRAQSINLLPGQPHPLYSELGENIHWVRYDEHMRILAKTGRLDAVENLDEERNVAIDQIEPGFIRLPAQARGDQEH